jgi:hypothetical protein
MQIVGQVVIRVRHKPFINCGGPVGYEFCYASDSSETGTKNITGTITDGNKTSEVIYQYGKFNYTKTRNSEIFGSFDDGYFLYFRPDLPREEFKKQINAARGLLFGIGAQSIEIGFCVYAPVQDQWVSANLMFNYGVDDQVILMSSRFKPFKPDPYDIDGGQRLLNFDIIRCCTNFVLNLIQMGIIFSDTYGLKQKKRKQGSFFVQFLTGITEEILLFVLFMLQLIFLL